MGALLSLYGWTIVSGGLLALVLALFGTQLASRDKAMQSVCVAQGASVGVILGIGFVEWMGWGEGAEGITPLLLAFFASGATYLGAEKLVSNHLSSRNTILASLFATLLATGFFLSALFPGLETHLTQVYFGDLSTLTNRESFATLMVALIAGGFLLGRWRKVANASFEYALFGEKHSATYRGILRDPFTWAELFIVCFSVQYTGFLFTVTALFLPTSVLRFIRRPGLGSHAKLCAMVAALSTITGFLLSLELSRFPTVPTVVLTMLATALLALVVERVRPAA